MDMDTGTVNSTMTGMMKPYIHFTPGDILYFASWAPESPGAMVGTCFALFVIAILERSVAAFGRIAETKWVETQWRANSHHKSSASVTSRTPLHAEKDVNLSKDSASALSECSTCTTDSPPAHRLTLPFTAHIEVKRGILKAGGAILGYILMLAVMTFNAGFILSIIVGLGVGEVLFGRFGTR